MTIHELKTDSIMFCEVKNRVKKFELRINDRNYQIGDCLFLKETKFTGVEMKVGQPLVYTGRELMVLVTHILHGPVYGLENGWVIMSISSFPLF